jgi:hypothetical protein
MNRSQVVKLQELNLELLDANRNLMSYLIQTYKKTGIAIPEYIHADSLLSQVSNVLQKINGNPSNQNLTGEKNNRRPNSSLNRAFILMSVVTRYVPIGC